MGDVIELATLADPYRKPPDYYAYVENARKMKLFTTTWLPADKEPRALVFLLHGFGVDCGIFWAEHGERLAREGYAVYGVDYVGHGRSEGLRAYIPDMGAIVNDCAAYSKARAENAGKRSFLYGESMGGAVALLMSRQLEVKWDGAVLVAPMVKISDQLKPHPVLVALLRPLARVLPTWRVVPIRKLADVACKDPVKRVKVSNDIEANLHKVTLPFLVLHGEADVVTDPAVSKALYDQAKSADKTIKIYPGMWHSLTEGEPDDNIAIVYKDVLTWLEQRA
eukprot:jgi/Mesen1/4950/ME000247S04236